MPENTDLLIVNPNGSTAITGALTAMASARFPAMRIEKWTLENSPSYIQDPAQLQPLLDRVTLGLQARAHPPSLTLVGCFSAFDRAGIEPPLPPTFTLAEACIALLGLRGKPFSIVTGGTCWQQPVADLVQRMGYAHVVRSVRVSELNAQQVLAGGSEGLQEFKNLIDATAREDDVDTVLLGGGGFIGKTSLFADGLACTLLDCGEVALLAVEALLQLKKSPMATPQNEAQAPT